MIKKGFKPPRKPWVLWLPPGVRRSPAFFWIGLLTFLSGLAILLGFSEPTRVSESLKQIPWMFNIWGGILSLGGGALMLAITRSDVLLEKMALRFLSLSVLAYTAWALNAVGASALVLTVLSLGFIGITEIRVSTINYELEATSKLNQRGGGSNGWQ